QQLVSFGTSGHRGTSTNGTFNEPHILATAQAICDYRNAQGHGGPLFLGQDTHALSAAAQRTALEVLAGNGVETVFQSGGGFTPTPVISHAILRHNRVAGAGLADGIVITPSHNPPADGGFKYNPPNGGPADTDVTSWIQDRANELLRGGNAGVRRAGVEGALRGGCLHEFDFVPGYVAELGEVVDLEAVAGAGLRIGVDPLGGAAVHYWAHVAERYKLRLEVVNDRVDPQFGFMTVDHDGKIRMDCSSPWAMAGLVGWKDEYDIAFGNDPDADRHGIVTPSAGLLNPNHYLCVAIRYLAGNRPRWNGEAKVGKTLVSSSLIDRVCGRLGRTVYETPVGFKWFTPGLHDGTVCFGGEESAGASFLRRDGSTWCTDKDGLILGLLACEMTARTGKDPGVQYREIEEEFGRSYYTRIDTPADPAQKARLAKLSPEDVKDSSLAGAPITAKLTSAPGNGAAIGGLKVVTEQGWFAARPSGTENIYKLYAESLVSTGHLEVLVAEARGIVGRALLSHTTLKHY
ncbi:MAG: alpha-D-glucose phosphate-specific phosphoglucomutase, partial [Candidatus Solibacter usitatus]|nr:alpha-D-glucose phosphate-specific phosphoglucomutase [Candidatus Solibacter usitatus]